ncbi:tetratricopeptide repeat protein, partial [Salmonella sp. s58078]|uniref:tetratricopeptide repeat protein n=1 Tax=Salmonella sp. s58078 TaxID=3159699 RepID=UPI00397FA0F9
MELDEEDISIITNRAAVYLEMGKYDECIKDFDKAVERGRELRSDYMMIARALTRKGTAMVKMAKCSKDFDPAIETFQKALTEHRNP